MPFLSLGSRTLVHYITLLPISSSRVYTVRRGFVIILAIQLVPVQSTVSDGHEMVRRKQPGAMQFELECLWVSETRRAKGGTMRHGMWRERTWVWIRSLTSRRMKRMSVLEGGETMQGVVKGSVCRGSGATRTATLRGCARLSPRGMYRSGNKAGSSKGGFRLPRA